MAAALRPHASSRPVPYGALLAVLIVVLAVYRLLVREALGLGLHFDEAQYFVWSLDPAWGYFSKPPMVAWAIGAARLACGDGVFCIRLPGTLAFSAASVFIYLTGLRLFDARTAFWAAVLFLLAPLVAFFSWFVTTDSLLLLAWSAALYGFVRALQAASARAALPWWLLTGAAAGLGLLSKYTMGIFAVSALGFLLTSREHRALLRTPGLWLGVAVAAALFAPNLVWNAQHGFATFGHTAEISNLDEGRFSLARAAEFAATQVGVFGPVAVIAFVIAAFGGRLPASAGAATAPRGSFALLQWFAWPFLLVITAQAAAARAHANWAAPACVAVMLLAAAWMAARPNARWLLAAVVVDVLVMIVVAGASPLLRALDVPLKRDPTVQLQGWDALGRAVRRELEAAPAGTRLLFDDRRLMSLVVYYAGPRAHDALMWNPEGRITNHYQLLRNVAQSPAGPFLLISERDRSAEIAAAFASVQPLGVLGAPLAIGADPRARRVYAWQVGRVLTPAGAPNRSDPALRVPSR
jgi:4-amino-4-deoxy-L-arabinose transferase-like glycosyltransferase